MRRNMSVYTVFGAEPDVVPRRRNHQGPDARALAGVANAGAVGREEHPSLPGPLPADAGDAVGDVAEAGARCRLAMLLDAQRQHRGPGCSTGVSPVFFFEPHSRLRG